MNHKPKQYIRGWVEFYKLKFKVTPDTLIPRPETELLVDEVLAYAKQSKHPEERKSDEGSLIILDLGTGAGNIAISIAKNLSHTGCVIIIATDVSMKALKVARQNAKLHGVSDKIQFIQSDLLSRLPRFARNDELIVVTNLPYIPHDRISYLDPSVKDFEPHVALDGGPDGFELYRKLFSQISKLQSRFVNSNPNRDWMPKLIIGEIDYTHGELAVKEAQKYFPDAEVEVKTDLAHKQRILKILLGW